MEHIVTVKSILKHNPCYMDTKWNYDADRIRGIVGDGIPLIDGLRIALDGQFPAEDAIWYATRPRALSPEIVQKWMEVVVTRAVTNHALGTCVDEWARKWLSGEDRSKESAAAAARSASSSLAEAAAWAAWAAWEEADSKAALAALRASIGWADFEAAAAAAAAERKQQIADLIAILEE